MTTYLVRRTKKHLTRYHLLVADGKTPLCRRASGIEAGKRGWQIEELESVPFDSVCWHCDYKICRGVRRIGASNVNF